MSNWLNNQNKKRLEFIRDFVANNWRDKPTIKYYTPHDDSHCKAVEEIIYQLIPGEKYRELLEIERFTLLASVWLHDIGMIPDLFGQSENDEKIRNEHHLRTRKYIESHYNDIGLTNDEAKVVKNLCLFHRKRENINKCSPTMNIGRDILKVQLLAAYLRLADALHADQTRPDEYLYKIYLMTNIPHEEKFHWIKSRAIESINPNADDMSINVKMFMPDEWNEKKIQPLLDLIIEEIQEELDTVKNILIRGKISMFLEVKHEIQKDRFMNSKTKTELIDILTNIELLRSPNASKIIEVVLENLITICESPFKEAFKGLKDYVDTLKNNILIQRSCHVALWKILEMLEEHLGNIKESENSNEKQDIIIKNIKDKVTGMKSKRKDALDKIREYSKSFLVDKGNILLFGYSDSIIAALEGANDKIKDEIEVFICECRNKTRYEHENKLVYSDAIYYAQKVKEKNYKNVTIISDCTASNILSRNKVHKIFLGANGIDKDYNIGHTVGHLMIADLANIYKIPVYVVAESLKFGDFTYKPDLERDNEWFTTMHSFKDFLKDTKILNYREDIVPPSKISYFITDMGIFPSNQINRIGKMKYQRGEASDR